MEATEVARIAEELVWLQEHPEFEERPATIEEFLGDRYLGISRSVRRRIRDELQVIFGDQVDGERMARFAAVMITGGIGIGKTTIASIILSYMVHWVLCLRNPQEFFDLMPGSRIAFMQMSTSEKQAHDVIFLDIKARLDNSPWFLEKYPYDAKFTKQLKFPKDIWIIPGDSKETTFEGYNILGGILDEMDSHIETEDKDYADIGYDTIANRIQSRFGDRGLIVCIGQMKKSSGFASRKYKDLKARPDAYVVVMAIWDSFGDDYYRCKQVGPHEWNKGNRPGVVCGEVHKFAYDSKRKEIVPSGAAALLGESESILWVPALYLNEFRTNPEKALKDLAGIPPLVGSPFISLAFKIEESRNRYLVNRHGVDPDAIEKFTLRELSQFSPVDLNGRFEKWFRANESLKRTAHLDIGYSADGDALGIAMGHIEKVVEGEDGELKPYIIIDCLVRMKAPAGGEVFLSEARRVFYALRDEFGFKLKRVTMDGFQSTDTDQQLRKRRFETEYVSVDRILTPYYDLRDAIYEERIEIPPLIVFMNPGDTIVTEVALKELGELVDNGKKIDHPHGGSKDVADAIAGVVYTLMGSKTYRRGVVSLGAFRQEKEREQVAVGMGAGFSHPAFQGDGSLRAPLPPTNWR